MQELQLSIKEESNNIFIVNFLGAFDGGAKENLLDIEKLVNNSKEKTLLIFNFEKLDYLNSYAIGQLVAWQNHLVKTNSNIIICSPSKNVEDILGVLGISNLFQIFPSLNDVMDNLKLEEK